MRAIWSGAITFGLVNVPVKLYSAIEDHDVRLHQVHDADGGRIRYQRRCEVCDKVVDYEHIDKAYVEDDETVVLTDEDFDALPQERSREISVVDFVPSNQIDPILHERSYYLAPSGKSVKAYVLLRRTLEQTDRTAVVQFALRQKTRLAALRVRDEVLMVQTLLWADEVREPRFSVLDDDVRVTAKELQLSGALVESFSSDFTPEDFRDEYQEELRKVIDAKLAEGESLDTESTFGEEDADEAEVIDLMEALKQSVQKSREAKKRSTKTAPKKKSSSTKASSKKRGTGRDTGRAATKSKRTSRSASSRQKRAG